MFQETAPQLSCPLLRNGASRLSEKKRLCRLFITMGDILAVERRKIIMEMLQTEKKVIVSRLSGFFGVSDETIRRDLDQLCQDGMAIKCYGGATLNDSPDLPFNIRKLHKPTEKMKIAEIITDLVHDGESIILDASTTAVFVAKLLKKKKRLTIVTNSIEVMIELSDMPDFNIICTGGKLKGNFLAFTGQRVISTLESFNADKLIFSCKALTIKNGIFDSDDDFAEIKRAMLKASKTKILAVDHGKFNKTAFSKVAEISEIDKVVTDMCPSKEWLNVFKRDNIGCLYASDN